MFSSSVRLFLVLLVVEGTYGTISDLRLCADPECRNPLSSGVAILRYMSIEPHVLSFNLGDEITIFSKEAGQNQELWGAEVRGKRGYIPKRLFKEMRVFVRNPSYTVATELIQPSMMQQMNNGQASSVLPQQQQQQQQPPPLQQQQQQQQQQYQPPVVPNGNYIPYQQQQQQQQQLPPYLNPTPHVNGNNFQPNGNMNGMQVPGQQMQQPMPMQPHALPPPPPTTTTTTSTQAPTTTTAETRSKEQMNEYLNLANESLPSLSEPSQPELAAEEAIEEIPDLKKEGKKEEESADEEDDGEGDEDEEDDKDEEDEESNSDVMEEPREDEMLQPTDAALDPTIAVESIELKKYPFEPVIESFDLPGLDHQTPISQLRSRSLEQGLDTPLIVSETASTEEALNTTGTEPVAIVEEEIAIKSSPEPLSDEDQVLLASEELTTNSTSLPAEVIENATVDASLEEKLNETGIVDSILLEDVDLKKEEEYVEAAAIAVETEQPTVEQVKEINLLPIEDAKNASLDQPTADVSTQEPTPNIEVKELPIVVEQQKPLEEEIVLVQEAPKQIEATVIDTAQTPTESTGDTLIEDKVVTQEDSSPPSPPFAQETKDADVELAPAATESSGSGGGLLDSALNWLGISDIDELAKEEASDLPSELLEEIAGLNPILNREATSESLNQPQEQAKQDQPLLQPIVEVPVDGFCHSDDCGNVAPPAIPIEEIAPPAAIPIEEIAPPAGPPVVHVHSLDDDGHHHHDGHSHHHDHPPIQQQEHHHDDAGCGHGHSHIPGYIPGFGHHYKKPAVAQQQQQAPPPVEEKREHDYVAAAAEANPPPYEPIESDPSVASSQLVEQVPSEIPSLPESSTTTSSIPDYIPVEEIFRAEMEKQKLLLQQEQSQSSGSEENVISWLSSSFHTYIPFLHDVEAGSSGASVLYPAVLAVAVVLFLSLHYLIQGRSQEKWLKAKISQLDAQLYETQTAKEECSSIQTQLTEYEKEAAELRNRVDQAEMEKVALSQRVVDLVQERDGLEKELETATEAATEANRMFEDLLNSQSETDDLQLSVETLQQKLTQQHLAIETLSASLSIKTTENETLVKETDELRSEAERYKVRVKTLQSDLEAMKTSNRNYQQKASQEGAELLKLKQEKDSWASERRSLTGQVNSKTKEANEWRDKTENLKKAIKAKENDLAKSLELLKQSSGGATGGIDSQTIMQLSSIVQLESDLAEANAKLEALELEVKAHSEQTQQFEAEKQALRQELEQLQSSTQAAAKEKLEAETRLQVLSNYFKEKETQLQKELGTHEAKRAMTEENVNESVKRILETEENLTRYKSQVESLTKEIEEQERSYKTRLAAQEKRAHDNWVQSRQLERRLEESKQEATQLRHRLTQAEKEKETLVLAGVKENGTSNINGELDLIKPLIKRPTALGLGNGNADDLSAMMDHPAMLSPPIAVPPPPPGMELGMGVVPPPPGIPSMAFEFCPPPDFIPPAPFMPLDAGLHSLPPMHMHGHHMPSIPPPPPGHLSDHHHRLPPLGMIAPGSFDVDYQPPPPRRYPSPPRRYPSPLGSERSVRSDRSNRMDRYDDEDHFRPVSPYGRHGGRPRSVGRSRDASPERPRSYSPLPSPLYPPHTTINSPDDWEDGRNYNRPPMMRSGSLRHPPQGPKTSSPLIQPMDNGDRQFNNNNHRR